MMKVNCCIYSHIFQITAFFSAFFIFYVCYIYIYIYIIYIYIYIHKTLGWITPKFLILKWLAVTSTILSCVFSKTVFSREGVKPCFFVAFNIIIRRIFSENFIKIPQVVRKIWRSSSPILSNFINFFLFFDISLLQMI